MILDAVEKVGGIYIVTADHGNAEDMVKRNKAGQPLLDKDGNIQILTSHTLQPVSISTLTLSLKSRTPPTTAPLPPQLEMELRSIVLMLFHFYGVLYTK